MNRLWVRISLVIGCIVLFMAIFPAISRQFNYRREDHPPPYLQAPPPQTLEGLSPEQDSRFREIVAYREYRAWLAVLRTILVGAIFGLLAGVLLSRWLAAPLRNLEQGAKAVAEGKLSYRVPLQGSQEVRSAAEAFNQMAEDLENAESLRRNLLADVTHELRHPVHILQGNLQAVLDGVYPLEMGEIASLLEHTHHLSALVNDLHELAQAEAHQLPLFKSETSLNQLVHNTTEALEPLYSEKSIHLEVELPAEEILLEVDAGRIRQALQNLLGNALHYSPQGGQVKVTLAADEKELRIAVWDNGNGISPQDLSHVFDRFYRADAARSRQTPGTGLGLAIAQAIIRAHAGQIEVVSEGLNKGSKFTIVLPK